MLPKPWEKKLKFDAIMLFIMYLIGIYFFIFLLQDYNHTFVHPDYYRYILQENLRDGLGISWHDALNSLQLRSPGEFRPRFLAYGIQAVDQKLRLFAYNYFLVYPTLAPIAWFLQLIIGPYYLYKGILNLTQKHQAAAISLIVYFTSIGFLSGFTMGLLQGKALANVALIISFFLMTDINKQRNTLLYETAGLKKYALLLTIFFSLFIDELPIFIFVFLPMMFNKFFFTTLSNKNAVKRMIKNGLFFCLPGFLFLLTVLCIVPALTKKYFGFNFDYLANTLVMGKNTHGAVSFFHGPYASWSCSFIISNILTMFGMSLVPWQISPLTLSGYGDYYGGQVNNIAKILILISFILSVIWLTSKATRIRSSLIGLLAAFGLYMLFLSLLLIRHIPTATGYYYGAPFAVFFALLIGISHYAALQLSKYIKFISFIAILSIICIQIDNFIQINRGWIKTHNEDIARPSFEHELSLSPPGPVSKKELINIWQAWKQGKLEKYLRENKISSGAIYLVFELRTLNKVKQDGFITPKDWRL